MTIFLLIGDPHFKTSNLDIMKKICAEILQIIDEKKPSFVISLGDTLDTNERIHMSVQTDATNFYFEIAERCPLYVLIGNHDRLNNQQFMTDTHPFVGLKKTKNITVVDKAVWVKELRCIFVPYVPPGRFVEALKTVEYDPNSPPEDPPAFLFAHQEFYNCMLKPGKNSADGDKWYQEWPTVFTGHIHEYQVLPSVIYVGTPHQNSYGEGTDKAIMIVHVDNMTEKKPKFLIERVRLKSSPIKTTINLHTSELPNFAERIPVGCMVKVILHADATETAGLDHNPYYQSLKGMVDKVVVKVKGDKASLAQNIVTDMKQKGTLQTDSASLEEVVVALLKEDPATLKIFQEEILK